MSPTRSYIRVPIYNQSHRLVSSKTKLPQSSPNLCYRKKNSLSIKIKKIDPDKFILFLNLSSTGGTYHVGAGDKSQRVDN